MAQMLRSSTGKIMLRNPGTGRIFPCCWADCEVPADARVVHVERHDAPVNPGDALLWVFCTERHRAYWQHAHRGGSFGMLPTGSKGLLGPNGMPL